VLLGKELLKAIEASRAVVLIWSEAAKNSAWGELDAAEFFVSSAIHCAKKDGADYWQAKHELELIQSRLKAAKPKSRSASSAKSQVDET
jgi:hypothetical protein